VKKSKLLVMFSFATTFVCCVLSFLSQSTGPLLADSPLVPQPAAAGSMAAKTIRTACYSHFAHCTKDSDCCTGLHCERSRDWGGIVFKCKKW
jgi:hypothetical protein